MQGKLWLAMLPLAVALAAPAADAAISDGWITAKTKIALLTTSGVSSRDINVDTVDGRVTLHGTVRSAEEKAKVEQEARKVQGVREVKNLLQVVPGARQEAVKASDARPPRTCISAQSVGVFESGDGRHSRFFSASSSRVAST